MKQSESLIKLAEALVKAQSEMGGAVKDASNPFFKSKYADLGSVIKAIKEPCSKHGLSYIQLPIRSENGVGVVTRLLHESGEWLEDSFTLPMVKNDPQAAGSAITYARRYALSALFAIPQVDTDAEDAMFRGELPEKPLEQWCEDLADSILAIKEGLESGDIAHAAQCWFELSDEEKRGIWVAPTKGGPFTTAERATMQTKEFKESYHGVAA